MLCGQLNEVFLKNKSISKGYVFCILRYCLHFVIWAIRGLLNNHRIMFISVSIVLVLENSKSIKQWFLNVFIVFLLFLGHMPDIKFLHNGGKFYPQQGNDFKKITKKKILKVIFISSRTYSAAFAILNCKPIGLFVLFFYQIKSYS